MIVDSHAHFWTDPPTGKDVLHAERAPIEVDEFVRHMDAAGVDKLIQITRGVMGFDNSYSLYGAAKYPDRIRVLLRFDVHAPDMVGRLRAARDNTLVVGLRLMTIAPDEARNFDDEATLAPLWAECERIGMPVSLYAPERSREVAGIAERHPGLSLIVDHVGMRVFNVHSDPPPSMADWPNLLALKRYPNVAIKVSGVVEAMVESGPFPKSVERMREIYDAVGPDRMVWGSNYPPVLQVCSYRAAIDFVRESCAFLSEDEKSRILGLNSLRILGLPWQQA